jgi:hypothetical protein
MRSVKFEKNIIPVELLPQLIAFFQLNPNIRTIEASVEFVRKYGGYLAEYRCAYYGEILTYLNKYY